MLFRSDHIMPAGTFLKLRSNVPEYAKVVFNCFNEPGSPTFAERALALKSKGIAGIIVAGESYGQGSSREHAALCPMYLGVRAVIAKTIERIHRANLINAGILPLEFVNPEDYERVQAGDHLTVTGLSTGLAQGQVMAVPDSGHPFPLAFHGSPREIDILKAGGYLLYSNHLKEVLPS